MVLRKDPITRSWVICGEELSSGSSPQMTQERVMGSLRNSIALYFTSRGGKQAINNRQSAIGQFAFGTWHLAVGIWHLVRPGVTWAFVRRNPLRSNVDAKC